MSAHPFTLRAARPDDAAALAALSDELGYPAGLEEIAARLALLHARDDQHLVVADGAAGLLGWIVVETRVTLESGARAEITGLVVADAARRSGLGRALVDEARAWAAARDVDRLVVRSDVTRDAAHPFYAALGFERTKTQHVYTLRLGD